MAQKITTGANDRPRNETIGQSGEGLPDDSSKPLEVDEGLVARLRNKLQGRQAGQTNTDEVPAGIPGAGENICRRCSGTGMVDGRTCPECGGTGKVMTPIGGG
ncbi:hypothetical protein NKI56_11285 [Mesorhizobium sp. M0622]|uniref:hypothetical protein n=1 Tax=unclassified Mesorhizobium TaxID=325217 RepID=UPI0033392C8C